ncbi:hypothetical protein V8E53_008294 [Lactarius tabidus]
MAHYDIFRHHLAIKHPAYGHALWEPSPGYSYPAVEIGDVGFVREGRFHRLFNVLLPAEDPSHENYGVPEYHEQLTLRMRNHIIPSALGPNNLCSARVTSQPMPRELAMGPDIPAEVVFSCGRKQGAILSLPIQARCKNTVALGDFGEWMIKHIDSWFAWVRRLGVGIEKMEDVVLVTGTHRTRSWTNVAFPGGQVDGLVSFGANVATRGEMVTINWKFSHEYTRGAVMNYGPNGEDLPEDQCIFIRGFRVARKLIILPRGLKAAAGPNPNAGGDDDYEPDVELMSIQTIPEYRDPLHLLLEYIVEEAPNCDMALVHDDDLARIDGLGDDTSLEALEPDAVLNHLRAFARKPKVHDILLSLGPSSGSTSAAADVEPSRVATLFTIFEGQTPSLASFVSDQSPDHVNESSHINECYPPQPYGSSPEVLSSSSRIRRYYPTPSPSYPGSRRDPGNVGLPPLPLIGSARLLEQIFTHSSLCERPRGEFEQSPVDASLDNEELAHIGDQVIALVVTDLILDLHPRLRIGPTSKIRDRIKRANTLAEFAVKYSLHTRLRIKEPSFRVSPNVQVDVFKAYVGGLFREQDMDIVKRWLYALFQSLVDVAYQAERRTYLGPGPVGPASPPQAHLQESPAAASLPKP